MSEDEERAAAAPEGSSCAEHPERSALVTCPRCGNYCCIACWHGSVMRCHPCLMRDPLPPVPWADLEQGFMARLFGTLRHAFSPRQSAPTFTRGRWQQGVTFALLTAVPIALLAGIIPFTRLLRFGPVGFVALIGSPTAPDIALDVLQAAGFGLLLGALKLALITLPFLSLSKAYGTPNEAHPSRQVMLYRAWLLLLGGRNGLLLGLVVWVLPENPSASLLMVAQVVSLLPLMAMLWSMSSTARMAGVGPFASMAVVLVPFLVLFLVIEAVAPFLPGSEAIREAVESASLLAPGRWLV